MHPTTVRHCTLSFCLILLFAGCSDQQTSYVPANPIKEVVIDGLKRPWSMAFLSEDEAIVTEKDGDLLKVNLQTGSRTTIHGIPEDRADSVVTKPADATSLHYPKGIQSGLKTTFNEGLFDVVLGPAFPSTNRLYLSYASEADSGTTTRVISGILRNDSLVQVKTLLLAGPHSDGSFHYGGALLFGANQKLYASVGDRLFSEARQPAIPISQNMSDRRGKIYRLNADGSIPADNPDLGDGAAPGIFANGIRNVQGMALHPVTGQIWFSEHGTIQGDEINVLQAGANYGWPYTTTGKYRAPNYAPSIPEDNVLTSPTWYWKHTVAPTGLVFYTGDEFPEWRHNLLVAGLSGGSLWRFRIEDNTVKSAEEMFVDERHRARNIVLSPAGALYLLTDSPDGKIIRIKNATP